MPTYAFPAPVHKDADNVPGQAFPWSQTFVGSDLTGYTAAMTIDGVTTNRPLTVTVTQVGVTTYTTLSLSLAGTITNTWLPGTYAYRVIVTAPDATTQIVAYGDLLEFRPRKDTVYGTVGPEGPQGPAGSSTGVAPSTVTTATFVQPAPGATVTVAVASSTFWSIDQAVFIATAGDYVVTAIPDATHLTLTNLDVPGSAAPGTVIASGVRVTCNGFPGAGTEIQIATTDATPTNLEFDLTWVAPGTSFRLDVVILARNSASEKSFTLSGLFRKTGSTITQIGTPQNPTGVIGTLAVTGALATTSSNTKVSAVVTGIAATAIGWSGLSQIIRRTGES